MWMRGVGASGVVALAAAGAMAQELLPDTRYLKPGESHNWTLTANVSIRAEQFADDNGMPVSDVFKFDSAAIVFPLIAGTASSKTDTPAVKGTVMFNDRLAGDKITILENYASGTRLGKWELTEKNGREMLLEVAIPVTSWETEFDEAAAREVPWPTGDWPPAAKLALLKEWYIDFGPDERGSIKEFDTKPLDELLEKWTNGKDPRTVPPVVLAKVLAGELVGHIQISGNGLNFNDLGQLEGISLQGVPVTAAKGQGSEFDAVCLLVAVYRRAGLPARVVVGYEGEDTEDKVFKKKSQRDALRAWAEFALYDEKARTLTWVPVDIVRRRKVSSRTPDWEKPWKYFGTHDELDSVIPFAFQFHPPTTVRAYGSPGFWGWLVMPEPPGRALQAVWFRSQTTPKRAEDPRKKQKDDDDDDEKKGPYR
jgi:hypothetical protein